MQKNGELVDFTGQLAQGLPENLLREARDFLRRERPGMDREAVEREAVASVRAWLAAKVEITARDPAEQGKADKLAAVVNGQKEQLALGSPSARGFGSGGFEVGQKLELVNGDIERNEWRPVEAPEKKPPSAPALRRGGGDTTVWLVFAAKRNGVMQ